MKNRVKGSQEGVKMYLTLALFTFSEIHTYIRSNALMMMMMKTLLKSAAM